MRVLVAPDKFKGSISALGAAEAIARGLRAGGAEVDVAPIADGGEGTMEAMLIAVGGRSVNQVVSGPLGDATNADFAILKDGSAVVELAKASGLDLVPKNRRNPLDSSTYGTGELLLGALTCSPARIFVALGGSATVDGGTGLANALGVRFEDSSKREIRHAGGDLYRIAAIDGSALDSRLSQIPLVVVSDVETKLRDAARLFGPQKGVAPEDIELLENGFANLGQRIEFDLGIAVDEAVGGGAAGGAGAMLIGLGADLRSGANVVLDAMNFDQRLQRADLVITGEGRLDEGTSAGKGPHVVAQRAVAASVPCAALVGEAISGAKAFTRVMSLVDHFGSTHEAQTRASEGLETLATMLISMF